MAISTCSRSGARGSEFFISTTRSPTGRRSSAKRRRERWAWSLELLRPGARADLILTRARDFTELFARPQADRTVLRDGAPVAPAPDYAEIDALEGLS